MIVTDAAVCAFDPTLSTLPRAEECPASCVLPRYDTVGGWTRNTLGSALHAYVELQAREGYREARAALPSIAERFGLTEGEQRMLNARSREFDLPAGIARVALVERPLCLLEDGSVVPVDGGQGKYTRPAGAVVAGTLDLVFPRDRHGNPIALLGDEDAGEQLRCPPGAQLVCVDTKSGADHHRPPIQRDLQALGSALLAARYTGAGEVVQMIWYGGDRWSAPPEALDAADLAQIETRIRSVIGRVREQARLMLDGKHGLMTFTRGPHCTYCPAAVSCPAQVRDLMAVTRGEVVLEEPGPRVPTVEDARRLLSYAATLDSAAKRARALAQQAAAAQGGALPIEDGPDGRVYARFVELGDAILPAPALEMLHAAIEQAGGGVPTLVVRRVGEAGSQSIHTDPEKALDALAQLVERAELPSWVVDAVRSWEDVAAGETVLAWEDEGVVVENVLDPFLAAVSAFSVTKRGILRAVKEALRGASKEQVSEAYRAALSFIAKAGGFVSVPRPKWRIGHRAQFAEQAAAAAAADDVSFDEDPEG